MPGHSFFKSLASPGFPSVERSSEERDSDLVMLREVNEKQLLRITELEKAISDLEEENQMLENEHLAALKTQDKTEETADQSKDSASQAESKNKQIDLLSGMLKQKESLAEQQKADLRP